MTSPNESTHQCIQYLRRLSTFLLLVILLAACGPKPTVTSTPTTTPSEVPATSTPDVTSTPAPSDTPGPTPTLTPEPLGSPGNPLQFGFLLPDGQSSLPPEADQLVQSLTKASGITIQAKPLASYPAVLAGMIDGNVHLAFLPPFTYLLGKKANAADVLLVSNHFGIEAYGAQFMVNYADGYTPFFDPGQNKNLAEPSRALAQFAGKRPCLVDPKSAAGYVVPLGILAQSGITIQDPVIAQSYDAVIRALFIRQICDFGAAYAISGDPRTSSTVLKDIPDASQRIVEVWQSDGVIPNLNVSVSASLPPDIRQSTSDALVSLSKTSDGQKLLSAAAGGYEIDGLVPERDDFYAALRGYVASSAVPPDSLMGN